MSSLLKTIAKKGLEGAAKFGSDVLNDVVNDFLKEKEQSAVRTIEHWLHIGTDKPTLGLTPVEIEVLKGQPRPKRRSMYTGHPKKQTAEPVEFEVFHVPQPFDFPASRTRKLDPFEALYFEAKPPPPKKSKIEVELKSDEMDLENEIDTDPPITQEATVLRSMEMDLSNEVVLSDKKATIRKRRRKFGHLSKMPRRRRRSSKKVTKRGVKQLIANYVPGNRAKWVEERAGTCYGLFGQRGFKINPILYGGTWGAAATTVQSDLQNMSILASLTTPNTGTVNENRGFSWKNFHCRYMFHNPVTEGVIVTVWLTKLIGETVHIAGDRGFPIWSTASIPINLLTWPAPSTVALPVVMGPVDKWHTEWGEIPKNTTSTTTDFVKDFCTYPTNYPEWNRNWKIVKKIRFYLSPGQCKVWKFKIPAGKFDKQNYDADIGSTTTVQYIGDMTYVMMMMTEGIPAHQHGDTEERHLVNRTATGIEWIGTHCAAVSRSPAQLTDLQQATLDTKGVVTSAHVFIPDNQTQLGSV